MKHLSGVRDKELWSSAADPSLKDWESCMPQLVFSQDQFKVWASEASGHQRPLGIRHLLLTFPRSDNIT